LVGFVAAYLAPLLACLHALRRRRGADLVAAAAGLFGLVALGVVGLTHDVLYHNAVALAYAGLVGAVLGRLEGASCASR